MTMNKESLLTRVSKEYTPAYTIPELLVILSALATRYKNASADEKHEILKSLFQFFEKEVFPHSATSDVGFIAGTLFPILEQAFPKATASARQGLDSIPAHTGDRLSAELYLTGLFDGDGCFTALKSGSKAPVWEVAIRGENSFKDFAEKNLQCTSYRRVIKRTACFSHEIMCKTPFFLANCLGLTIKFLQFQCICNLAGPLSLVSSSSAVTSTVTTARRAIARILSALNNQHAVGISREWFQRRFMAMACSRVPLALDFVLAGWTGSDGCVNDYRTYICQSNQAFCEGLADAFEQVYSRGRPSVLKERNWRSVNSRGVYRVNFTQEQTTTLLFRVGIFDYARRSQWLVVALKKLVKASTAENKDSVLHLLNDLLSYIKRVCPS